MASHKYVVGLGSVERPTLVRTARDDSSTREDPLSSLQAQAFWHTPVTSFRL
jgi:hypothetical protein